MNSFNVLKKWVKSSSFGLILTSFALVFVICVGLIVNQSKVVEVTKPTDSVIVEDSVSSIVTPTIESTQKPLTEQGFSEIFT